jgi:hypothetical protein
MSQYITVASLSTLKKLKMVIIERPKLMWRLAAPVVSASATFWFKQERRLRGVRKEDQRRRLFTPAQIAPPGHTPRGLCASQRPRPRPPLEDTETPPQSQNRDRCAAHSRHCRRCRFARSRFRRGRSSGQRSALRTRCRWVTAGEDGVERYSRNARASRFES